MGVKMTKQNKLNRRRFLQKATGAAIGAVGFPYFVPSSALGKAGTIAPSNRISLGFIGVGWQGTVLLKNFLNHDDAQVIALCDVDSKHLNNAREIVGNTYGKADCRMYKDFRQLLARDDIDAVVLALPDHWHAIAAITAAQAGKDIYSEKPLAHSLREGRAICNAVKKYGIVWQTGSHQRSMQKMRFACELVRNGRIGKVVAVEARLKGGHKDWHNTSDQWNFKKPPKELDYNMWLGPAPYEPYCLARVHRTWRYNFDYGGGSLMDWIGHHGDIALWGLGLDRTAPVEVEATGTLPKTGLWNTPTEFNIRARYANGLTFTIRNEPNKPDTGAKWIGEEGWVKVYRPKIEAYPASLLKEKFRPDEIHLYQSLSHTRNFLDCIKSRQETIVPCEVGHRAITPGHLGLIAMRLGRKIRFNPDTEEIINDETASRMLGSPMRSPWHL
jgi:predicted dehydrogenase